MGDARLNFVDLSPETMDMLIERLPVTDVARLARTNKHLHDCYAAWAFSLWECERYALKVQDALEAVVGRPVQVTWRSLPSSTGILESWEYAVDIFADGLHVHGNFERPEEPGVKVYLNIVPRFDSGPDANRGWCSVYNYRGQCLSKRTYYDCSLESLMRKFRVHIDPVADAEQAVKDDAEYSRRSMLDKQWEENIGTSYWNEPDYYDTFRSETP